MRALLSIAILLAYGTTAETKDIVLPLNDREQAALRELLDIATKAGGLGVAQATVHFATKLQQLQQQAEQPAPVQPDKN